MSPLQRLRTWSLRSVIWFSIETTIGKGNSMYVGGHIIWLSKRLSLSLIESETKLIGSVEEANAKHLRAASFKE